MLPSIEDKVILRPGSEKHYIPNPEYGEFWEAFYEFLRKNFSLEKPLHDAEGRVNPYFGNFGLRYQATTKMPKYFHLGMDFSARAKTAVYPIFPGLLEYSGYAHINGKYVFLSHPEITTEDGFQMYSLYLHMKTLDVGFGHYQKMLRRISFNKYPNVPIEKGTKLGGVGSTGNIEGFHTHLHLQIEFRNEKGKIIVIDPAFVLGIPKNENLTLGISGEEEFMKFAVERKDDIKKSGVEKYWKIK